MVHFLKMHGLGNDFVIIDNQQGVLEFSEEQIRHICHRRRGVGCDQLIVLERPAHDEADFFMRIYNPDRSQALARGNATRCVAYHFMQKTGENRVMIETVSGLLACRAAGDLRVTVDMGSPGLNWDDIPLSAEVDTLKLPVTYKSYVEPVGVSMGNPHCVFFVEDCRKVELEKVGPEIEFDPLFPDRTNVEFVSVLSRDHLRMRVWERGAGITQACGSGACAAAVAAIRKGLCDDSLTVSLDGGDLIIEWDQKNGRVLMTGEVTYVFTGELNERVRPDR